MGRKAVMLSNTKSHLTKNEKAMREKLEEQISVGKGLLKTPAFLTPRAKKIYERLLEEVKWADNLDQADLVLYAFCWDRAQKIMEILHGLPDVVVKKERGQIKVYDNLNRRALKSYTDELRNISARIGISHSDRLRFCVSEQEEQKSNKFIELKARLKK